MEALKIEILNRKALTLIKEMQALKLIKVTAAPAAKFETYLKKMRRNSSTAPGIAEITKIVEKVRAERNAKR